MSPEDCFANFNPSSEGELASVVENWSGAYLDLASEVAKHIKGQSQPTSGAPVTGALAVESDAVPAVMADVPAATQAAALPAAMTEQNAPVADPASFGAVAEMKAMFSSPQ